MLFRSAITSLLVDVRANGGGDDNNDMLAFSYLARRPFHEHRAARVAFGRVPYRRYLTVVPGVMTARTITSNLVADRGDGRRGSTPLPDVGKVATTHVTVEERLPGYTLLSCRLETGRTHQIRIHLSEAGHPVCGDKVYTRRRDGTTFEDKSGAPRLALHATELGFTHPASGAALHWSMPLPADLAKFIEKLRGGK